MTNTMSMRTAARILGVSHAYLSQIRNGKRPLPDTLRGRLESMGAYHLLTNGASSGAVRGAHLLWPVASPTPALVVGAAGIEPATSCSHDSYNDTLTWEVDDDGHNSSTAERPRLRPRLD